MRPAFSPAGALTLLILVAGCAPEAAVDTDLKDAFAAEDDASLVTGFDCTGAGFCISGELRPNCFAAVSEGKFGFRTHQRFDVPAAGSYNVLKVNTKRLYPGTNGTLRVRVFEYAPGVSVAPEGGTEIGSTTVVGSLLARTSASITLRFNPALNLGTANASTPRYGFVFDVPTGRLGVALACTNAPGVYADGDAGLRKLLINGATVTEGTWSTSRRDVGLWFGFSASGGGTCSSTANAQCDDGNNTSGDGCSATCQLEAGFSCTGLPSTCTDADECAANTDNCAANATCTNTPGSFTCACNPGYTGPGTTCGDLDECTSGTPCGANGSCSNTVGAYTCACNSGYTSNGTTCVDVNECTAGTPCGANGSCNNTVGAYTCSCNSGYTFSGGTCGDLNECTAGTPCGANGSCSNTVGAYTCACNSGYSFNGTTCVDVNECTAGTPCGANGSCNNTTGAYTCTCNSGYTFSGGTCADTDECATGTPCGSNGSCTNTTGAYTCLCSGGYAFTGGTCADVNECLTGNGGCSSLVSCTNTIGGRTCGACPVGYTGDGVSCIDTNECLVNNGGCDSLVSCTNTAGSRTCGACPTNYTGTGDTVCAAQVVLASGVRAWANGSTAISCEKYRRPGVTNRVYSGNTGDGLYRIDPDGDPSGNAAYVVYCDMTLSNGGWTRVVTHGGQNATSWFWSNSPTFYNSRITTGNATNTTADHWSYAASDLPAAQVMITHQAAPTVPIVRTLPAAFTGSTYRGMTVAQSQYQYGAADGALNGKWITFGSQVYGTQRLTQVDFTQAEMLSLFPTTAASDYNGGVLIAIGALDRSTFADPWHVQYGPRVAFIDSGSGNGNPCTKLTASGYSQINGAHSGGHDCCTATNSAEAWYVYVK